MDQLSVKPETASTYRRTASWSLVSRHRRRLHPAIERPWPPSDRCWYAESQASASQLARAAAETLGRAFVSYAVDSRTETRDLLWTVDSLARHAEAQLMGAQRDADPPSFGRLAIGEFVHPGPLWWAFDWDSARKTQAEADSITPPFRARPGSPSTGWSCWIDGSTRPIPRSPTVARRIRAWSLRCPRLRARAHRTVQRPLVVITTNEGTCPA